MGEQLRQRHSFCGTLKHCLGVENCGGYKVGGTLGLKEALAVGTAPLLTRLDAHLLEAWVYCAARFVARRDSLAGLPNVCNHSLEFCPLRGREPAAARFEIGTGCMV